MDTMDDEVVAPATSAERTTTDDLCSRPYGTFVGDAAAGSFQNDEEADVAPATPEAQQHANVFGDVDSGKETITITTTIITPQRRDATRRDATRRDATRHIAAG